MSALTIPQVRALRQIRDRNVVVVWHADEEFSGLGLKPWYALSGGVLPTQLHTLWLDHLIRADRGAGPLLRLDSELALVVGRARLTPMGKAVVLANAGRGAVDALH